MKNIELEGKPFSMSCKDIEQPKIEQSFDIIVCSEDKDILSLSDAA